MAQVKPQKVKPQPKTKPTPKPKPKPEVKTAKPTPRPKPKPTPTPPKKVPKPPKKVVKPTPPRPVRKKPTPTKRPSKRGTPTKKVTQQKTKATSTQRRKSRRPSPNKGPVEAYRSSHKFSGRLSSLLAKGGRVAGVQAEQVGGESVGIEGGDLAGDAKSIRTTKIAKEVGSLEGATTGKLDQARGTEGLVDKKSVAFAGIPSRTVVMGDYDASRVADILREHLPQFRRCYQRELDRENRVSGKIELHFNIGASGSVTKAGVAKSALPSAVEGCVINVLRGIKFPPPLGGGIVAIRQPMYFEPRNN